MLSKIKKTSIWFCIFFGFVILPISEGKSQDIDEKYIPFLPVESEMTGYSFKKWYNFLWGVEKEKTVDILRHVWISSDEESEELLIEVCIFNSASEAITGTSYQRMTYSVFYLWGSISGSIDSDHSWYSPYSENKAQFIVRGNVGIRIVKPPRPDIQNLISLADIVSLMLNKIENNLPADVLLAEEEAKRNQISREKYEQLTAPVLALDETRGFTLLKEWDSKWVVNDTTFSCGRRTEWENETGTIIGIDICEFETEADAQASAERQAVTTNCKTFDMDDISTLQKHIDRWNEIIGYLKYLSAVSYKGRVAVFIYQYNPEMSKTHIFKAAAYELVEQTNFLVPSAVDEEGGAAEAPRAFKLHQNRPNPFNPSTIVTYELEHPGSVSLRVYDILGREVAVLDEGYREAGAYSVFWNGTNNKGAQVSSGVYFCRLASGGAECTKRMTLIR